MKTKKGGRRGCFCWSPRRSPVLVTLVTCVIVLQTFIIVRMRSEKAQEAAIVEERREVSSVGTGAGTSYPLHVLTPATQAPTNIFDTKACSCGLHFQVDPEKALMLPRPALTEKKYLTIGIPTILRQNDSYITQTLTSLLANMHVTDREDVVIVVMIADQDPHARNTSLHNLKRQFQSELQAGKIHVIAPPPTLYVNFKVTKQTYGQALSYVEWRSKQNYDYAYLMRYSAPLSLYYMQLEDDVIVAKKYVSAIRQYIDQQKEPWTCLEFSELGFIGKLFRSKDLDRLSQLLMMFFQEQPVDYTYLYYNMLMTQLQKRLRTPTLFQHQGVHSSFPGKIQPLKDRFFDRMEKVHKGDNPTAEIYSTLKTYLNFVPRLAYTHSEGYFWTDGAPSVGDSFIIVFDTPQRLDRVIVETGSESHPTDILVNATLKASLTLLKNPARLECTNDVDLGVFQNGRVEVKDIEKLLQFKVICLQIQVTKPQSSWLIIREIAVFVSSKT